MSRLQPDKSAGRMAAPDTLFGCWIPQDPEFPGGNRAMHAYLQKNLRYPPEARRANVQGKVFVSFTVNTDGSLTDVTVLRGLGHGTNEEAIRLIEAMPHWEPGRQSGKVVRVKYVLPITFKLD